MMNIKLESSRYFYTHAELLTVFYFANSNFALVHVSAHTKYAHFLEIISMENG